MKTNAPLGVSDAQWSSVTKEFRDRPSTINDYRKVVERLHKYREGMTILNMTKDDAAEFFSYLENESGLSENTVHRYQATLRSIGMRMEKDPEHFPGYVNPFRGLLKNEIRKKTVYKQEDFARPQDIRKILRIIPEFPRNEQLILYLMTLNGLYPKHICSIQVNSFQDENGSLSVRFLDSLYRTDQNEMPGEDLKKRSRSVYGTVTYESFASFRFFEEWSKILKEQVPDIGHNEDTRPFFMTSRHLPYTYHAIHHLVRTACEKAGLSSGTVTPRQLSLYGIVHSFLMENELRRHNTLTRRIRRESDPERKEALSAELEQCEAVFLPLANAGWIGCWKNGCPPRMVRMIYEVREQLGEDSLYRIAGLKK